MNIPKSFIAGFKKIYELKKIINIIFGATVLVGFAVASSFYSTVSGNFPLRMDLNTLFKDFNATIYMDFMNNYGDMIKPYTSIIIWLGAFYFFFTVFFAGGILKLIEGSSIKSKAQAFFAGSAKYFFRFLRLGIYVMIFQLITFAVIAIGFSSIFNRALPNSTEPKLFTILVIWAAFHFIAFFFYSIISDYAKIILVKEDSKKVLRALWNSLLFSVKKIYITYPMYLLLLVIPLLLFLIYLELDAFLNVNSGITIIIMLVLQQLFVWARIFCKAWILGSEYDLFQNYLYTKNQPLVTQEMLIGEVL